MPPLPDHRPADEPQYIDVDRQPEEVRQFFASLDLTAELVIVLNGQPRVRLLALRDG